MSDPVTASASSASGAAESDLVSITQLKINEIEVMRSNTCPRVDVFVPKRETISKYGNIRGQIGQFHGTWKNIYRKNMFGLPWKGYGPHFYPDRDTFFDRNYNGSFYDDVGLAVAISSKNPASIAVGAGLYGGTTGKAGTLRFVVCDD